MCPVLSDLREISAAPALLPSKAVSMHPIVPQPTLLELPE